jgi:hypothetical protein
MTAPALPLFELSPRDRTIRGTRGVLVLWAVMQAERYRSSGCAVGFRESTGAGACVYPLPSFQSLLHCLDASRRSGTHHIPPNRANGASAQAPSSRTPATGRGTSRTSWRSTRTPPSPVGGTGSAR